MLVGLPLDLRIGRQGQVEPWRVVAELAVKVHAVPAELPLGLPVARDCQAFAENLALSLSDEDPLMRSARAWLLDHLPPPEPSALLHGDLLGQNVHLGLGEPDGVLDWERAEIGDPAWDLAVVTRGVRRPFQLENGLGKLVTAYSEAGGRQLTRRRVQFYELVILATQYDVARATGGDVLGTETRLGSFLKRLT